MRADRNPYPFHSYDRSKATRPVARPPVKGSTKFGRFMLKLASLICVAVVWTILFGILKHI
jgi:hypothetical protein